ncbi:patatin-like phospholipase domain-containing protein 2 isoform X2 [Eriocheir sinensis]|nr:patatin-like phospholipase domain-containing protein 2 isoform X2 [Eriocheir sinensis]
MDSVSHLEGSRGWTTMENCQRDRKKKNIDDVTAVTFCGCGFLGVYLVGVATYMQQHVPQILRGRLGGSSVGSLIATCLACDVPIEVVRKSINETAEAARQYTFGVFNPFYPLEEPLLGKLLELLPEDAHIRASGRLYLSLTRASTLTNEVVCEYATRDELLRAVLCCCFLPGVSGFSVPTFQGHKYIDGGMSNNMPLKGPSNISVNVFAGEFDICPEEQKSYGLTTAFNQSVEMSSQNVKKFFQALLPPIDLDDYYEQGYLDAKKYFTGS